MERRGGRKLEGNNEGRGRRRDGGEHVRKGGGIFPKFLFASSSLIMRIGDLRIILGASAGR